MAKTETEAEKRLRRCCFSAQGPDKLKTPEEEVKAWFGAQIDAAVAAGYRTFLCGCGMGADLQAGLAVLRKRDAGVPVKLICVVPWPGFPKEWIYLWQTQYEYVLEHADYVKFISKTFRDSVFRERNEYMVLHSSRLVAWYEDGVSKTWDMMEYAVRQGIGVVTNQPELVEEFRAELEKEQQGGNGSDVLL